MPKFIGGKKQKLYCGGVKIRKQYCQQNKIYSSGNFVYYNVDGTVYSEEYDEGLSVLSPSSFVPTKSGWEFLGWRSDTTASSNVLGSLVMGDEPITLYAVFRQAITVTYYNNSTSASKTSGYRYYNSGNVVNPTFKLTQATRTGWTARGWSIGTTANADITFASGAEFKRDTSITLYGMYQQNITVTYYNNSAYASTSVGIRYYNSNTKVLNPTFALSQANRNGWSAVGWSTSNSATGAIAYGNGAAFTRDSNITLYGRYNQTITVTYYNNSTSPSTATGTRCYNSIGNMFNPSFTLVQAAKSGWTARGWSTGTAGNAGISYNNNTAFTRDSNTTLYGMYEQTITLSYNGNGATSGSIPSQTGTRYYNSKGTTVNPSFVLSVNRYGLSGYGFAGWSTVASSKEGVAPGTTVTLSASTNYFAIWALSTMVNGSNLNGAYNVNPSGWWGLDEGAGVYGFFGNTSSDVRSTASVTWNDFVATGYSTLTLQVRLHHSVSVDGTGKLGCQIRCGDLYSTLVSGSGRYPWDGDSSDYNYYGTITLDISSLSGSQPLQILFPYENNDSSGRSSNYIMLIYSFTAS